MQDKYVKQFKDESQMPKIKGEIDWETPDIMDFDTFVKQIQLSKRQHQITIVEGFLIYHDPRVIKELDKTIFMNISKEIFLQRRKQHNEWSDNTCGADWYLDYIWESYQQHGQLPKEIEKTSLILNGERHVDMDSVMKYIGL